MSWIGLLITLLLIPVLIMVVSVWLAFKIVLFTVSAVFAMMRAAFRVVVR